MRNTNCTCHQEPLFTGNDVGRLRREAIERARKRPLPKARIGLCFAGEAFHGRREMLLWIRPVARKLAPFQSFTTSVLYAPCCCGSTRNVMAAEVLNVPPVDAPDGSWVLRLVQRAYRGCAPETFSEKSELLMRIDPDAIEVLSDEKIPGHIQPVEESELAREPFLTTPDAVSDLFPLCECGEMATWNKGHTSRIRFTRLYANGELLEASPRA